MYIEPGPNDQLVIVHHSNSLLHDFGTLSSSPVQRSTIYRRITHIHTHSHIYTYECRDAHIHTCSHTLIYYTPLPPALSIRAQSLVYVQKTSYRARAEARISTMTTRAAGGVTRLSLSLSFAVGGKDCTTAPPTDASARSYIARPCDIARELRA